MLIVIEIHN